MGKVKLVSKWYQNKINPLCKYERDINQVTFTRKDSEY